MDYLAFISPGMLTGRARALRVFFLIVCLALPAAGCGSFKMRSIRPGMERVQSIEKGDVFLDISKVGVLDGVRSIYRLAGIDSEGFVIESTEYAMESGYNTKLSTGRWVMKQGMQKRHYFPLDREFITVKGQYFQILSIADGILTTKRVRSLPPLAADASSVAPKESEAANDALPFGDFALRAYTPVAFTVDSVIVAPLESLLIEPIDTIIVEPLDMPAGPPSGPAIVPPAEKPPVNRTALPVAGLSYLS